MQGDDRLSLNAMDVLNDARGPAIGVHVISCWETAMLHVRGRLTFSCDLESWIHQALAYPRVRFVPLTISAAVDSCCLPGEVHRDPADRMLIGAARELRCPLLTADRKILAYEHVDAVQPDEWALRARV